MSLPVWEEWIEINVGFPIACTIASLPVWEEWIEIVRVILTAVVVCVSSRMGRVD